MKKCETFGCLHDGVQAYQIAPGTNVWLCADCLKKVVEDTKHPQKR